jgi:ABC-type oligopeptide transport system ATPase subunit
MTAPIITGIAGGSGCGKTTLAEGLCRLTADYGSVTISLDDYYRGVPSGVAPGDFMLGLVETRLREVHGDKMSLRCRSGKTSMPRADLI